MEVAHLRKILRFCLGDAPNWEETAEKRAAGYSFNWTAFDLCGKIAIRPDFLGFLPGGSSP
jgi:hypothetical protein